MIMVWASELRLGALWRIEDSTTSFILEVKEVADIQE